MPLLIGYRSTEARTRTFNEQWPKLHSITNRVHGDLRQIGAATGRMACRRPNLQNVPRDPEYRSCFVSDPGNVLVRADYSQIELRLVAEIAQDPVLMECFRQGQDIHRLTAMSVTGKETPEEVTDQERQLAKALNFGLIFGMGHRRLAATVTAEFGIELSEDDAEIQKVKFFQAYSGLREWQRKQGNQDESRTILGRRRVFDGGSYYTERLNSPVQGSAADGLKLALARLWETPGPEGAFPVLVVHDEIVVEAPADKAQEAKEWLIQAMVEGMMECQKEVPVVIEAAVSETW